MYSIIYINGYQLVKYESFSNCRICDDISILRNIKESEYIEKIKYIIDNSQNKEELSLALNELIQNRKSLNYLDENKELIISKDEMTFELTSTYIQKIKENTNSNSTVINLGKCETILKNIYNISEKSNLYILKIDKEQKGKNYPLIEYEVFCPLDEGKIEILNLSFCKDIDIELLIPITINHTLDKYNPKSNYYNDICSKATSEYKTDITLNDRRNNFIKNNMSLCENNCKLTSYDHNKKRAKCSCKVKTTLFLDNIELNSKNLVNNFKDIKKITNIEIVKCYKIVFNIKNIKNNYGFFIFIFIFLLYFLCLNIFYYKSLKNLIKEIKIIVKASKYINNNVKQTTVNNDYNSVNNEIIERKRNNLMIKVESESSDRKIIKANNNIINTKKRKNKIRIFGKKRKMNKKRYKKILEYIDSELNELSYEEASKIDKRNYIQYYWSLLKKNHLLLFSFYPNKDYNSQVIKSFLFFFYYSSDLTINALFFTDNTIHKIYIDSGLFNLNYQLPRIIYSFLISWVINTIIKYLSSSSESTIILIKNKKGNNSNIIKKNINNMKIKFRFFFIITFILLLSFWYYISCFCCIYENTQLHLIKDSLIGLAFSLIYPFLINLLPGIFRIWSFYDKKGDKKYVYKISQIIENIC